MNFLLLIAAFASASPLFDARLSKVASSTTVIVAMQDRIASSWLKKYEAEALTSALRDETETSYHALSAELIALGAVPNDVYLISKNWINNTLTLKVSKRGLELLSHTSARKVYFDGAITGERALGDTPVAYEQPSGIPYDFVDTKLDQVIKKYPDLTGKDVLLGSVDTGVLGSHSALKGKILHFYDATQDKVSEPLDYGAHGTHTTGTMVGGDRQNVLIGMAPDAKMLSTAAMGEYSSMIRGMQWLLSEQTLPRAVNNSWNCDGAPDLEPFYRAIEAWEAAGILPVFSAGNNGPDGQTITTPKEHPLAFSIGATGADGKIGKFSSRGPAIYRGQEQQKPDITAPGVDILSSLPPPEYGNYPNGYYGKYTGTSMAAPHVTGTVALLTQADPKLNPAQLRVLFRTTATPTGIDQNSPATGWNEVYGFGKLDILKAVETAKLMFSRTSGSSMTDLASTMGMSTPNQMLADFVSMQGQGERFNRTTITDAAGWVKYSDLR